MSKDETIKVNKDTKHITTKPKWYVLAYEILRRTLNIIFGLAISYELYDKCLMCKDCNNIVIIYFSLLEFICFINGGIPVNKLIKINSFTG